MYDRWTVRGASGSPGHIYAQLPCTVGEAVQPSAAAVEAAYNADANAVARNYALAAIILNKVDLSQGVWDYTIRLNGTVDFGQAQGQVTDSPPSTRQSVTPPAVSRVPPP